MKRLRLFIALTVLALGLSLLAADAQAAATFATGSDPAATLKGAVRYRNFGSTGSGDIRVGASDGSGGITSPTPGEVIWGSPTISKSVTFSYNGTTGALTATVTGSTPTSIVKNVGSLGPLNYLQIKITKNTPTTSVSLNSLNLGSGSLGNCSVSGGSATVLWRVTGVDLTSGFTLSGTLAVNGLSGSGDSNFVQVDVGYVPPPDELGPEVTSIAVTPVPVIINGQATVWATVDDTNKGGNYIASAKYSLNGGPWLEMVADDLDGFNNEVAEDVKATFTAFELGENEVCVYGTDIIGNEGDERCQTFLVTYKFDGFFSPIENNDFVNMAKAGQAVPAKWRLTDADDVPIADPASFVSLNSYPVNCTDFLGNPLDSIEEIASGNSGLQYNGDGYWQFNWKTPKDYANTCRAMYVEFNSGATSPVVRFQFKK